MAHIIGFLSQKASVSKSTLARAFAVEARRGGVRIKLADLDDRQHTSYDWSLRRPNSKRYPQIAIEPHLTVASALADQEACDLIILDGPGRAQKLTAEIAGASDVIIQPVGPALDDLDPNIRVFDELANDKHIDPGKLVFAITRAATDAEVKHARAYLAEVAPAYAIIPGYLKESPAYRDASNRGLTIAEASNWFAKRNAHAYLESLYDEILKRTFSSSPQL